MATNLKVIRNHLTRRHHHHPNPNPLRPTTSPFSAHRTPPHLSAQPHTTPPFCTAPPHPTFLCNLTPPHLSVCLLDVVVSAVALQAQYLVKVLSFQDIRHHLALLGRALQDQQQAWACREPEGQQRVCGRRFLPGRASIKAVPSPRTTGAYRTLAPAPSGQNNLVLGLILG